MKDSILIEENVALAPLTTLGIGGRARLFARAESERQVAAAFEFAAGEGAEVFVLGGGSNVLVADRGFGGLVLQIALKGVEFSAGGSDGGGVVHAVAQAGEDWDSFCELCVEKKLQGVECLSGIPGLVGGTPVQNVGAYGQEVAETILKVRVFDRLTRQFLDLASADCRFAYRQSIFNTTAKNRFVVLAVTFALKKGGAPQIVYKDLCEAFGDRRRPTLAETRDAVLAVRRAKSMVIDPADPNSRSAGSFFKNPVVTEREFARVAEAAKKISAENVPHFKFGEARLKIPAAWLIENAGFRKGHRSGRVGLSTNHTLAVVNLGGASAREVIDFQNTIRAGVEKTFGVELEPEPVFVGFH